MFGNQEKAKQLTLCPEHGSDEMPFIQYADAAMYWAKQHGKDNSCLAQYIRAQQLP